MADPLRNAPEGVQTNRATSWHQAERVECVELRPCGRLQLLVPGSPGQIEFLSEHILLGLGVRIGLDILCGWNGAAEFLRSASHACPVVSAGSTPTLMSARRFDGLTEFRAGVSVFFDLFQAGVGVCRIDDIALSVLATVIGHPPEKGWTITDAGWDGDVARPRHGGAVG